MERRGNGKKQAFWEGIHIFKSITEYKDLAKVKSTLFGTDCKFFMWEYT